jgi:hypothetical protein
VTLVPFLVLAVRCSLSGSGDSESPCLAYVAVFMLERVPATMALSATELQVG